jgi:hypothetical protein
MKAATRRFSNEYRFNTPQEIVTFAHTFLKQRVTGFTKDIDICLTPNKHGQSAYLPGLMACISFLDLLTGLYVGRLDTVNRRSLDDLQAFAATFLDPKKYQPEKINIFYQVFRHKLAHLGHPHAVFDTDLKPKAFPGSSRRLIAWSVTDEPRKVAIALTSFRPRRIREDPTPWPVYYAERMTVSVPSLAKDALHAAYGPNGYLSELADSTILQGKFKDCMGEFYPRLDVTAIGRV